MAATRDEQRRNDQEPPVQNANQRMLYECFPPPEDQEFGGIGRIPVPALNFDIKYSLIQMVQHDQFGATPKDDPHAHIAKFLQICDL